MEFVSEIESTDSGLLLGALDRFKPEVMTEKWSSRDVTTVSRGLSLSEKQCVINTSDQWADDWYRGLNIERRVKLEQERMSILVKWARATEERAERKRTWLKCLRILSTSRKSSSIILHPHVCVLASGQTLKAGIVDYRTRIKAFPSRNLSMNRCNLRGVRVGACLGWHLTREYQRCWWPWRMYSRDGGKCWSFEGGRDRSWRHISSYCSKCHSSTFFPSMYYNYRLELSAQIRTIQKCRYDLYFIAKHDSIVIVCTWLQAKMAIQTQQNRSNIVSRLAKHNVSKDIIVRKKNERMALYVEGVCERRESINKTRERWKDGGNGYGCK